MLKSYKWMVGCLSDCTCSKSTCGANKWKLIADTACHFHCLLFPKLFGKIIWTKPISQSKLSNRSYLKEEKPHFLYLSLSELWIGAIHWSYLMEPSIGGAYRSK